jgi:hypothetical protein
LTTLIVFSHPNHELAIFGLLQRLRPYLVFLTDGGGGERLAQTRRGLQSIGLLGHASFLDQPEKSFYDALLARDSEFYKRIADMVSASVQAHRPDQILCDAIEFYNPVHDISLPVVRAALRGATNTPVFEVPLIYQRPGEGEAYEIQRTWAAPNDRPVKYQLCEQELAVKVRARDRIYTSLADQMGPLISELPGAHLALEFMVPARSSIPEPGPDIILRYEWRARLLAERGEIEQTITYKQHYLPVASSLLRS